MAALGGAAQPTAYRSRCAATRHTLAALPFARQRSARPCVVPTLRQPSIWIGFWQDLRVLKEQSRGLGGVSLRPPRADDSALLIAARDDAFHRWLGPGSDNPSPTACIIAGGQVVGWVDYEHDVDHDWLGDGEVNVGYFVFAEHRGNGYATGAVELLVQQLARDTQFSAATLLIDPENEASLAVAVRCGFSRQDDVRGQRNFTRPII
jgi:RimJ/RimL family protein N-acetyltransferase